ncbi:MAG: UDP-N-acetylmuramoyl-L-alanyl-D-glutamate--2,6-diaminopimelate ligase [Candidatus Omnitrophica bacterium]|nr:UDP-N-acetylmuramoyl-L-alanyl-D-glutamate--2,6-diaminopimelate ligase [Candidatus Omnitrophota bacterium]
MLLRDIIKKIPHKEVLGKNLSVSIEYASSDSRLVFDNSIFLVRKGANFNALDFIPKITKKVACFMVSLKDREMALSLSKKFPKKTFILVQDIDLTAKRISEVLFKGIGNLKIIGVTGTNGKTTTSFLINKVLNDLNKPSALLGTVYYRWGLNRFSSFLTTPDNFMLKSILHKIYNDNIKYAVLEVSSHGLSGGRIEGLALTRAIFTNLTHDHLDFHKNLNNYFRAKLKIFDYLKERGSAIINIDDPYGYSAYRRLKADKLSYGIEKNALYKVKAYRFDKGRLEFLINLRGKDRFVKAPLLGLFNIYNVLACLCCCDSLGLALDEIIDSISSFSPVPGRMEQVKSGVFVDYAHTPHALRQSILALRHSRFEKIIVVFGCGGDRDRLKRPKMGKIAARYADYTIITSDNPRTEEPGKICRDIQRGIAGNGYEIILDRKKAIMKAVKLKKQPLTAVLIAGKGHENYQILKDKRIKFRDKQAVKELTD